MSLDADALAEMARNRGLKLVRSRVRTPGKAGFGLFGLVSAAGEPVFGMDGKAPAADAEAVAGYLRGAEVGDWKASLKAVGASVAKRKRVQPPPAVEPKRTAEPAPPSPLSLREAKPADAPQIAALFATLGAEIAAPTVARNLQALAKDKLPVLVAVRGADVLAVCGLARTVTPHRPAPVGRITVLVVAEAAQRQGLGRRLVQEAERRLLAAGCELLEITSNDRLTGAHAFYRRLGYERTSMRFAKPLPLR